jgi:hypothetical protein
VVAGALLILWGTIVGTQGGFHTMGTFFYLGEGAIAVQVTVTAIGLFLVVHGARKRPNQDP